MLIKEQKLIFLKIFFHSKIGCKGLYYQSSALTISQRGIWKVSTFVFVKLGFSIERSVPGTNQSLQIRWYLSVYVFWELSKCVYPPLPSSGLVNFPLAHSSSKQGSARDKFWGSVCSASGTTLCFKCLPWLYRELHRENGHKNRSKL